jgi:predicted nucleic acid-binding protein
VTVTADTSVLVASLASWHQHHEVAFAAAGRLDGVIAHSLLETYSVLTRMPAPHRMSAAIVARLLEATFEHLPILGLAPNEHRKLIMTCAALGIGGGSIYDAMIAASCARAKATLLTLDARAHATYAALKIDHELLV